MDWKEETAIFEPFEEVCHIFLFVDHETPTGRKYITDYITSKLSIQGTIKHKLNKSAKQFFG